MLANAPHPDETIVRDNKAGVNIIKPSSDSMCPISRHIYDKFVNNSKNDDLINSHIM